MSDLEKAYYKGVRWSLLGSAGTAVFQFLQMIVFARLAPPEAMGDYILGLSILVFLTPLAEAGLGQALVQREQVTAGVRFSLLAISLLLAGLLYAAVFCLAPALAGWFERPVLNGLLRWMGITLCLAPLTAVYNAWLIRQLRFATAARIEITAAAGSFVVVLIAAIAGAGAWAMAAGFMIRSVLTAFLTLRAGTRSDMPFTWLEAAGILEVQPFLRAGMMDIGVRWTDFLSNYLDKMIIGKYLGAAALGHYNLAFTILTLPSARLGSVIARVSFPAFSRIQHDREAVRAWFLKVGRQLVLLLLPMYLLLIVMAPELVRLVFGDQWGLAAGIVPVLALGGFMRSSGVLLPQLARGLGRMRALLIWTLSWASTLVFVLLIAMHIQPDLDTAAWSRALPELFIGLSLLVWLGKQCGVSLRPVLSGGLNLASWLGPWMLLVYFSGYLTGNWLADLVLKSLLAGTGAYMLIFRSRFSGEYRGLLRSLLP